MNAPDRDIRELLQPLRAAEPPEDRPLEPLDRAIEQASESMRRRRGWKRRLGPPAGLVVGLFAVSVAAATATGVISFRGLAGMTSRDDTPSPDLSALVQRLERQPRDGSRTIHEPEVRSGLVTRDGLEITITLTEGRMCLFAPGQQVIGRDYVVRYGVPDRNLTVDPAMLAKMTPLRELLANPRKLACVAVARLGEQLPTVAGFKDHRSWVVTLAPDQVDEVRATTVDGQTVVLESSQNLAVGHSTTPFTKLAWVNADGDVLESALPAGQAGGSNR